MRISMVSTLTTVAEDSPVLLIEFHSGWLPHIEGSLLDAALAPHAMQSAPISSGSAPASASMRGTGPSRRIPRLRDRFTEEPHLSMARLLDGLVPMYFEGSCQALTLQNRDQWLRPAFAASADVTDRPNAIIERPPGEEAQFDRVELPDAPAKRAGGPSQRNAL